MIIEIGEIYYLCQADGTAQYIKPTTGIVYGWDFPVIYYIGNIKKNFKGYIREETYLSFNNLKNSIFIHNKDFDIYPSLCKDYSEHLTKKEFVFYKRQILINSIID